jgi:hypothetical protein
MNTNYNTLSDNNIINNNINNDINNDINNKGFTILHSLFKEKGWYIVKNELNWISYTKFDDETSFFEIKILPNKITVCVPIKNSQYQFITSFKGYFETSEFIEKKLLEYTN